MTVVQGVRASPELLEPLRRTLRWLAGLRGADGRVVCPWHRVEHTGSNAGLVVLACELLKHDPAADRAFLVQLARTEAARLVVNLAREGTSECFTFRPGRHDPFNCSNGIIDGGACADALAQFVLELGAEVPGAEVERARDAALLHARTYLRYAVLDKGIPAQRAWGLTGLAGAWALAHDGVLADAARQAFTALAAIQHADGSYPYHPLAWGAEHAGASDVSSFYQSRPSAFVAFALGRLGISPADAPHADSLRRGLAFLLALQGPDGLKCGLVEAKPWYWGAHHEVASHPFDVYAFAAGARVFGDAAFARAALRAFRAWSALLGANGEPRDHAPAAGAERSYQCPVFWAGHAAWIARALPELARSLALAPEPAPAASVAWFADAQLARLENEHVIAWVRGARPAANVNHGSPRGAGLVRVVARTDGAELVARSLRGPAGEAEWTARGRTSLARGWRSGASELRFSLWQARVHARAGRTFDALAEPARVFRRGVLGYAGAEVSSAWALAPVCELVPQGIVLRTPLAHRDGTPVPASACERRFTLDARGLRVEERLLADGGLGAFAYAVPRTASAVERSERAVVYHLP